MRFHEKALIFYRFNYRFSKPMLKPLVFDGLFMVFPGRGERGGERGGKMDDGSLCVCV